MGFFRDLQAATIEDAMTLARVPQIVDALAGRVSRASYIAYLTEAYHHVRHTVPLMRAAQARLDDRHAVFRAALDEYVAEETGHEEWILDDIAAAGGDRAAAAASEPRMATELMVAYAYDTVQRRNPMGFFGMVFVLEGTSVLLADRGAKAVQEALGLPPTAFRYLTSHGALDQQHIAFFERLMERVEDGYDRAAITHVARRMFALFGGVLASIPNDVEAVDAA